MLIALLPLVPLLAATCIGRADGPGGHGCIRQVAGHRVLDLRGTETQIGSMYGELLRDEMRDAYVPMMETMFAELGPGFGRMWTRYRGRFSALYDLGMQQRAQGLESSLGLKPGTIEHYAWFSELGTVGPAMLLATAGSVQFDATSGRTIGGCTSVVGNNAETTVHARNVDYWGMGFWQPHATLVFIDPRHPDGSPDGFRYAHLSDVGEIWAGTTGVNERGLVVTTHLHVSRDVAPLDGALALSPIHLWARLNFSPRRPEVSVYRYVESLLRRARTVAEAAKLATTMRPLGSWSFILSDPAGGRAVIDATPREVKVHHGATVGTNFYLDEQMRAREVVPSRGPVEGADLRYARASDQVALVAKELTVDAAFAILRDRYDLATQSVRAVSPNTIASPDATQSVVIETRVDRPPRLWIAEPHADGYFPSPFADVYAIDFESGFDAQRCPEGCITEAPLRYQPNALLDLELAAYVEAMRLQKDSHDPAAAAAALQAIVSPDPSIPLMAAWLFAFVGNYEQARVSLHAVNTAGLAMNQQLLAGLLEGDLSRLANDKPAAKAAYTRTLDAARLDEATGRSGRKYNAPLLAVLQARLRYPNRKVRIPEPDLKFQDVLALYP